MTDRTRQLGASTTAPVVSEPCTECRGFFNVPQMRRGRWAAGVCHACGGAGTRDAQVGRVLPDPWPQMTTEDFEVMTKALRPDEWGRQYGSAPPTLLEQVREAVPSRGWNQMMTGGVCTCIAGDILRVAYDRARDEYVVALVVTGAAGRIGRLGDLPAMFAKLANDADVTDPVLAANLRALATPCP